MIQIANPAIFQKVVSQAIETVTKNRAFDEARKKSVINAISKAVIRIKSQGEFMHYDLEADRFLIWSQASNLVYDLGPDGRHGCLAELNGALCWHKAAKRLISLYNAAMLEAFSSPAVGEASKLTGTARAAIIEKNPKAMPYMQPEDARGRERG